MAAQQWGSLNALVEPDGSGGCTPYVTMVATTAAGAAVKTSDYDTGAGTDTVSMVGIALPASGGAVAGGTATNPLVVSPGTPVAIGSAAYVASLIIKASAGKLYSLNGYNSKTSAQFIQVHNSATLPADTAVPLLVFTVPASSNFSLDFSNIGLPGTTGLVVCNSSTGPTKTLGSADVFFSAVYI